ncbi:MAG TPA: dephospho-CoA kinase [Desulfuromonadales bacterium]|nr:dephospho-CoA kinase [Desulfuromonadales bacterium]
MHIIGLTGGIACGKSSVATFLRERGVPVIDADQLSREAVQPGSPALERIAALFGADVLTADGELDRAQVGAIIFADAGKRQQLEAILHPQIRKLADERIAHAVSAGHRRLVYMAPLLIEAGVSDRVDEIWVVTVADEIQLERLMERDHLSRDQALQRVASQMPLAEKALYGKVVIDNSGTPQQTERLLEAIWAAETKEDQ